MLQATTMIIILRKCLSKFVPCLANRVIVSKDICGALSRSFDQCIEFIRVVPDFRNS